MPEIRKYGRTLTSDESGYLINDALAENITPPWSEAVAAGVAIYREAFGPQLRSVYLRGSVARGLAVAGWSDIDLFGICRGEADKVPKKDDAWIAQTQAEYKTKFPFVGGWGLELSLHAEASILSQKPHIFTQFKIFHAVCVDGEDLKRHIPRFKANYQMATQFVGKPKMGLARAKRYLAMTESPEEVAQVSKWYMRRLVRNAMLLVMPQSGCYTPDIYYCWELFSQYYPEQKQAMWQALDWALKPCTDQKVLSAFLDDFAVWFTDELDRVLISDPQPVF